MNQISNIFSQFNYQTQSAPPPPPSQRSRCAHHQGATNQVSSGAYLSQLMASTNNLLGGWQSFSGLGSHANPGFDTSYANPGFDMSYANAGLDTSYTNPGFGLGSGGLSNPMGAAGLDMSAYTALMGNSILSQSLSYGSGLGGLGLGSLSSSYPSISTNAFPYELLLQGMPSIPTF